MPRLEENVLGPSEEYKYNLSTTEHSSHKYGNCQVCGEHASEVFMQTEFKKYERDEIDAEQGFAGIGWSAYSCHDYFGHEDCLKSVRR